MPTYDYKCATCDHRFEAFQSITEPPVSVCPHCGGNQVERLISPGGGLIFKGSGFYITDYRKESYRREARKESPASASTKSDTSATKNAPSAKTTPPKD